MIRDRPSISTTGSVGPWSMEMREGVEVAR